MQPATEPFIDIERTAAGIRLRMLGAWTMAYAPLLERATAEALAPSTGPITIDASRVERLDTLGAWLMERLARSLRASGREVMLGAVPDRYGKLLAYVAQLDHGTRPVAPARSALTQALAGTGRAVAGAAEEGRDLLAMLGALCAAACRAAVHPRSFRLTSTVHHFDRAAWQAMGIILLITFLIGGIIAQQGFFHFRRFGADDYVVDLVAILVVREIGVLIVAIMVAGRSGSAYTAELGSMRMREEIDALRTMGLDPVDVLMLPRSVALVLALPVLTLIGDLAALYGGGLVAWLYGGMSPSIYLARLQETVSLEHLEVGLIKAPFIAMVIATVACANGLKVKGSAESLGLQTTTSVVTSIFLVIVLDGLFAVFFASIGV